jgi:hypothetical protein
MANRISRAKDEEGFISPDEARAVLGVLCVKYGFCLPRLWHARLIRNPPVSVAKFTDTVISAEGLDPLTVETALYKAMYAEVQKAFERSARNEGNQ